MAAKDMNFTMDRQRMDAVQQLMQKAQAAKQAQPEAAVANAAGTPRAQAPVQKAAGSTPAPVKPQGVSGLSLLWPMFNSAALVAVAAWFYWQGEQTLDDTAVVPDVTVAAVQAEEFAGVKDELAALKVELDSQRELTAKLQAALASAQESLSAAEPDIKREPPRSKPNWVINAGDYRDQQRATAAAGSLRLLGYQVELTEVSGLWQLRLPGFEQRAQAEEAARQIMAGSELNGLWVSKLPAS